VSVYAYTDLPKEAIMSTSQYQGLSSVSNAMPSTSQFFDFRVVTITVVYAMGGAISSQLTGAVPNTLTVWLVLLMILLIVWLARVVAITLDTGKGEWRYWTQFLHRLVDMIVMMMLYIVTQTLTFWFLSNNSSGTQSLLILLKPWNWIIIIGLVLISVLMSINNGPQSYAALLARSTAPDNSPEALRARIDKLEDILRNASNTGVLTPISRASATTGSHLNHALVSASVMHGITASLNGGLSEGNAGEGVEVDEFGIQD